MNVSFKKVLLLMLLISVNCLTIRDKKYREEKLSSLADDKKMEVTIIPTRVIVKEHSEELQNIPSYFLTVYYNSIENQFLQCDCFREVSIVRPEQVNMLNSLQKYKIELKLEVLSPSLSAEIWLPMLTYYTLGMIPTWGNYEIRLKATVMNDKVEIKKYTYKNAYTKYRHLLLLPFFWTNDSNDPNPMMADLVKQLIFDIKKDKVIPYYK